MLKNIANKSAAADNIAFLDVEAAAMGNVRLPVLQKQMIEKMQNNGGRISMAEVLEDKGSHKSTLKALQDRGLVKQEGDIFDGHFVLVDDTVYVENKFEIAPQSISAEEFKGRIAEFLGKKAQVKLSRILGANVSTVRKWAQGVNPVPAHVVAFLAVLEHCQDVGAPLPTFVEAEKVEQKKAA